MCNNCAGSPSFRICAFWCFSVLFRGWYRLGWTTKHHNALKSTTLRAFWCFLVLCRYLFFWCACFEDKRGPPPPLKSRAFWCFLVLFRDWYRLRWVSKRHKAPKSTTLRAFWCFLVVLMRLRGRQSWSSPPFNIRAFWCFFVVGIGFCG